MYLKSLIVFVLCTAFVAGFAIVLNYEAAGIGVGGQTVTTLQTSSCSISDSSCMRISITSAYLHAVNYTDELGIVNYATLKLGLNASGPSSLAGVKLFVGNLSAGVVQGPFEPGVNRVVNLTLPATVTISPGKTYLVSVEGLYNNGSESVWASTEVTAQ